MSFYAEKQDPVTLVLPLATSDTGRDGEDLRRFGMLLASIERYFDWESLEQLIVVSPAKDVALVREAAAPLRGALKIDVLDETEVCTELRDNPDTLNPWPKPNHGWKRQQLIKLAIHERVRTKFYLTLDADVLFVRECDARCLIGSGRAVVNIQTGDDYRRLFRAEIAQHESRVRELRYAAAERLLRMERPRRYRDRWYGETPVLLNVDLVRDMTAHLAKTWKRPWVRALLENPEWTEYPLYFLFAETGDALEQHYAPGGCDTLLRFSHCLWRPASDYVSPRDLSNWDVDAVFGADHEGVAVVVQSYLGYPVGELARRVGPYIGKRQARGDSRLSN